MTPACRACGSERVAPNVPLGPAGGLRAHGRVCADCGLLELYVDEPMAVYQAHGGPPAAAATANTQCPSCGSVLPAAATACEACGWPGRGTEQGGRPPRS